MAILSRVFAGVSQPLQSRSASQRSAATEKPGIVGVLMVVPEPLLVGGETGGSDWVMDEESLTGGPCATLPLAEGHSLRAVAATTEADVGKTFESLILALLHRLFLSILATFHPDDLNFLNRLYVGHCCPESSAAVVLQCSSRRFFRPSWPLLISPLPPPHTAITMLRTRPAAKALKTLSHSQSRAFTTTSAAAAIQIPKKTPATTRSQTTTAAP